MASSNVPLDAFRDTCIILFGVLVSIRWITALFDNLKDVRIKSLLFICIFPFKLCFGCYDNTRTLFFLFINKKKRSVTMNFQYRDNLNPKAWGPPAWKFLDFVIAGYPEQAMMAEQVNMATFLQSLGDVLPCGTCRRNYEEFLVVSPPELYVSGKEKLFTWVYSLKKSIKK